jgi:ubiquinone biosynthesis protein
VARRGMHGAIGVNTALLAQASPALGDLLTGWRLVTSLLGVLVIAWVAGRLLGARRSWGSVIVSAVVGWIAGATLAVILAKHHEHGTSGFTRNLWLFSAFFTMSTTVWIEMLAKPGALARAQRSLSSIPRPFRTIRRKSQRLGRYAQITRLAARHGLGRSIGIDDEEEGAGPVDDRAPAPVRVRRALEDAGGMFVKLGQVLSTRADLLPPAFVSELSRLQDHVAPVPRDQVQQMLESELGCPTTEAFAEFDWRPVAAASIGQAYRARLHDGEIVIVKVQRPGVAQSVERDLEVLVQLGRTLEARAPWAAENHVMDFVHEFADRLREELDFRIEARNAGQIASRLGESDLVEIPRVHGDLSTSKVLVMQWLDGVNVRDAERVDTLEVDRRKLAECLLRAFLQQVLGDGLFHSDPHPGNVMVLSDGHLGLIDFGATGTLDAVQQASLRQMLLAVSQRDAALLRQALLEVATVRQGFDDEQFERGLARFMARHLAPGTRPSAAMFTELLQLLFAYGVVLPAEYSTLFRSLVTLEGTLTTLCPGYLVMDGAQAIAGEWFGVQLEPANLEAIARDEVVKLAPVLRRIPRHIDRLATMAERGDLRARVSLFSVDEDVRTVTKLVNRILLASIGGAVGIISVILIGIKGGPVFTGRTSLYEFFGYFGLFCSTILVMRVLVAIFRDGMN